MNQKKQVPSTRRVYVCHNQLDKVKKESLKALAQRKVGSFKGESKKDVRGERVKGKTEHDKHNLFFGRIELGEECGVRDDSRTARRTENRHTKKRTPFPGC